MEVAIDTYLDRVMDQARCAGGEEVHVRGELRRSLLLAIDELQDCGLDRVLLAGLRLQCNRQAQGAAEDGRFESDWPHSNPYPHDGETPSGLHHSA